jgi:phytoene synthase
VSAESVDAQLQKLHARRPELALQAIFLPAAERSRIALWYALQDEIEEACFELSEPFIAQTKLAWWADELTRGVAGQGRHPLVQALFDHPSAEMDEAALWRGLAEAGVQLVERDLAPSDIDAGLAVLRPMAAAIDALERRMFGGEPAAAQIAGDLLLRRMLRAQAGFHAQARLPRNLLARHGLAPAHLAHPEHAAARAAFVRDFALALTQQLPPAPARLARPRALQVAVARWRLDRLQGGDAQPQPRGVRLLLSLWAAARRSAAMPTFARD